MTAKINELANYVGYNAEIAYMFHSLYVSNILFFSLFVVWALLPDIMLLFYPPYPVGENWSPTGHDFLSSDD